MCQATTGGNNPTKLHSCETLHCSGFCSVSFGWKPFPPCVFCSEKHYFNWPLSFSLFSPHRLLHLAIIHEATDHAFQMIKLSHNHPFLNVQNHQRQVIINPDDSSSATRRSNQTHNGPLKSRSWLKHDFCGSLLRLPSTSQWSQSSLSWSRSSWRPAVTRGCRTTAGTRLSTSPARGAPSPASGSSPRTASTTSPPSCPSPTTMVIIELQ